MWAARCCSPSAAALPLDQPIAETANFREFWKGEVRRIPLLETVWKIAGGSLDRLCLVAQEAKMGHLRPVLATRYTPDRRLFGFSRQSLEKLFGKASGVGR